MDEPLKDGDRETRVLDYAGHRPAPNTNDRVEFCGIRATPNILCSIERGSYSVVVPCKGIARIRLRQGNLAPHPILLFILGLVLISCGVIALLAIFGWMISGGPFSMYVGAMGAIGMVGISLLRNALRTGLYLEVKSTAGVKRLVIDAKDIREVEPFLGELQSFVGVKVER